MEAVPLDETPISRPVEVSVGLPPPEPISPSEAATPSWREELSQRVERFRRRRAHIRGTSASNANLEFDFDEAGAEEALPEEPGRQELHVDIELGGPIHARAEPATVDALEVERLGERDVVLGSSGSEVEESDLDPSIERRPVEFVLDPAPRQEEPEEEPAPLELPLAPLGRRFWGGMIDLLVLIVAAGVFALIFWRAGGRMSMHPLNLIVVAFIAALLVCAYFGVFTALTSTTPGLLWMGIEVRSFKGGPPTPRQAAWRAFGYLMSASALMLGFVWAVVDSDSLTWHDRMSDTFLTPSEGGT